MGGCQNCGPLLGPLNIKCRIIIGTQKGTIILTTTHIYIVPSRIETETTARASIPRYMGVGFWVVGFELRVLLSMET